MLTNTRSFIAAAGLVSSMLGQACHYCFVRGTKILTPRGPRRIEELKVGDEVYSLDVVTRKPVARAIARTLRAYAPEIFQVAAGELVIAGVTADHPFYVADVEEWTKAAALVKGMRLVAWLGSADVREIEITAIHSVPTKEPVEVYNLTIDGPEHNYFADGLLVHNKEPPMTPLKDADGDGFFDPIHDGSSNADCNDSDPTVNPGAAENCSDGKDNDCDGLVEHRDPDCGGDPCPLPTGVYALRSIFFGETNRDGTVDLQHGWKQYGHDIDWHDTTTASKDVCKPLAGGTISADGYEARDNSFGQNIVPILREYFPNEPDLVTKAANGMIEAGLSNYLFAIDKVDVLECANVTTRFYRGWGMLQPPIFDGTDEWPLDPAWLKDPASSSLAPNLMGPGQLVSSDNYHVNPEGTFEIRFDIHGSALVLPIRKAFIVTDFPSNDKVTENGQLSGIIDTEALVEAVTRWATVADPSLCDPNGASYQALADRIRRASDIWLTAIDNIVQDPQQNCNAVSIGIGFSMRQAKLGNVAPPLPPDGNVCLP